MTIKSITLKVIEHPIVFYDAKFNFRIALNCEKIGARLSNQNNVVWIKIGQLPALNLYRYVSRYDTITITFEHPEDFVILSELSIDNANLPPFNKNKDIPCIQKIHIGHFETEFNLTGFNLSKKPINKIFTDYGLIENDRSAKILAQIVHIGKYDPVKHVVFLYIFDGYRITELSLWHAIDPSLGSLSLRVGRIIYLDGRIKFYKDVLSYVSRAKVPVVYQFPKDQIPSSFDYDLVASIDVQIQKIKLLSTQFLEAPSSSQARLQLNSKNFGYFSFANGFSFSSPNERDAISKYQTFNAVFQFINISHPMEWIQCLSKELKPPVVNFTAYVLKVTPELVEVSFNYPLVSYGWLGGDYNGPCIKSSKDMTYTLNTTPQTRLDSIIIEMLSSCIRTKELVLFKDVSLQYNATSITLYWFCPANIAIVHPGLASCRKTLYWEYLHRFYLSLHKSAKQNSDTVLYLEREFEIHKIISLNYTPPLPFMRTSFCVLTKQCVQTLPKSVISVIDPMFSQEDEWISFVAHDISGVETFVTTKSCLLRLLNRYGIYSLDNNPQLDKDIDVFIYSQLLLKYGTYLHVCIAIYAFDEDSLVIPPLP